ncbi:MAG TPA: rod shape-determining protein MreD [Candidatus Eisenbacteria bacterium]|nr:rod shape-determining protein MreD [Candidatus Eisenbacteria bacterium]
MILALYFFSLLLAIGLEATIFSVPLTLVSIIALCVMQRKEWVYIVAVAAGLLLDSLTFRPLGVNALFFLIAVGLIFLYQKKFETHHMLFGVLFSLVASGIYLVLFTNEPFVASMCSVAGLSSLIFGLPFFFQSFPKKTPANFIL